MSKTINNLSVIPYLANKTFPGFIIPDNTCINQNMTELKAYENISVILFKALPL